MFQSTNTSRSELLKTLQVLQQQFAQSLKTAQQQEHRFEQACATFQKNIAQHLNQSMQKLAPQNPLFDAVSDFKGILEHRNNLWKEEFKKRNTGVRFRAGFNDSLLVFVYGKVKSGKSSLGNYVAWGNTDPTQELQNNVTTQLQPKYFSQVRTNVANGDIEKEAELNKMFRVGATEATSSIQGFSLPGLTWVDSPGLHSCNKENGELAKEYVSHSDLVLYAMKSDSPGRESDIQEILDLYREDKKIIILLTGSDDTDEDCDDETGKIIKTVVMKSRERREKQQEYVHKALEELQELKGKTENIEIISLSARYAQLHSENTQAFYDSGMGQLFGVLNQIALAEGVKLKQRVPIQNFYNFINDFEKSLESYQEALIKLNEPIQRIQKETPIQVNEQLRNLQKELKQFLESQFLQLQVGNDDEVQMNRKLKELTNKLQQKQTDLLQQVRVNITKNILNEMKADIQDVLVNTLHFDIPEFKTETRTEQVVDYITQSTKARNSAIGTIVGGILGLVGGPTGVAAGSVIGGLIGNALGDDAKIVYKDVKFKVGDNFITIQQNISNQMLKLTEQEMENFKQVILEQALNEANQLSTNLEYEIKHLKSQFQEIKLNISKSL